MRNIVFSARSSTSVHRTKIDVAKHTRKIKMKRKKGRVNVARSGLYTYDGYLLLSAAAAAKTTQQNGDKYDFISPVCAISEMWQAGAR